jgi:REP element-mobilizing transposase RayT
MKVALISARFLPRDAFHMTQPKDYRQRRHVRGVRVYAANRTYHLRTSAVGLAPLFGDDRCKQIVRDNLKRAAAVTDFCVIAYVIMPEHVHMIVRSDGPHNISQFMASFKKHSARKLNKATGRSGPVWRREFFDHILRSDKHLRELIDYIHDNPVRRGLVPSADKWEFSSWHEMYSDG